MCYLPVWTQTTTNTHTDPCQTTLTYINHTNQSSDQELYKNVHGLCASVCA